MTTMCKKLLSKGTNSRLEPRNAKSLAETKDLCGEKPDSGEESADEKFNVLIVADTPNLYKHNGAPMSDSGFIALPRSLLEDPKWLGMKMKYQRVFLTILTNAVYKPTKWDINGNSIVLMPGQLCISLRRLVEKCNEHVRFKSDMIDKNIVEDAVSLFTRLQIGRQEERHGITILTITIPITYDTQKTQTETQRETKQRHKRDTNKQSNKINKSVCYQDPVDLDARAREKENKKMNDDEKKEIVDFVNRVPQTVEKRHVNGGMTKVELGEIITQAVRERKEWDTKEIHIAWEILVNFDGKIRTGYGFINGTIKKIRNQKRSNAIPTKKEKEEWTHPSCRNEKKLNDQLQNSKPIESEKNTKEQHSLQWYLDRDAERSQNG